VSITIMPQQTVALRRLVSETGAFELKVESGRFMSLRAVTFTRHGDFGENPLARWWTISAAGGVKEEAADPGVLA
jgi:hypothetical protein